MKIQFQKIAKMIKLNLMMSPNIVATKNHKNKKNKHKK